LTLEQVYNLMDKLSASGLGEVEIESEGVRVKIKAKHPQQVRQAAAPVLPAPSAGGEPASEKALSGKVVKSPIVGTFYEAAGPGKDPFVRVGDPVKKGDVLFIVESMKLMNEVSSDFDGKVAEILVENGQPVEFGQLVMRIE